MREKMHIRILAAAVLVFLCAASSFFLTGCQSRIGGLYFSGSLEDTYIAATDHANLTVKECNLIFMDYQNRYNAYYSRTGLTDFWNSEAPGGTFSDYLKENRIKEEICVLLLLNDMAAQQGVTLSEEELAACKRAAEVYYSGLLEAERTFCKADMSDAEKLYLKYCTAQKMISVLTEGSYLEISDNDKRVITIQVICMEDAEAAKRVQSRVAAGEDFLQAAKENSILEKVEYQVSRGSLNPLLEEVAFYLEDGEISEVLDAGEEYFIIKCIDDFDEAMSMANEEAVYRKSLYEQWYPFVAEYAKNCSVGFSKRLWNKMKFYETQALTADNLYSVYEEYVNIF